MSQYHPHNKRGNVATNAPLGPEVRVAHGYNFRAAEQGHYNLPTQTHQPNGRKPWVLQTPYAVTLPQSSEAVPRPFYHDEMFKAPLKRNSRIEGFPLYRKDWGNGVA